MNSRYLAACIGAITALLALVVFPAPGWPDDFYKHKTLTILVGFPPGGGFDTNARLLSRYIGRHIPGDPNVIVVNSPGAASSLAVQRLDVNMPTDGTVIDEFNFGLLGDSLLRPDVTKIDFRRYQWIGSISEDVTTCYVFREDGPKTIAEMRGHHYTFGDAGPGASEDINTKILQRLFHLDITEASGYSGSAEVRLAIQRGEVDGECGTWSSLPPDFLTNPKLHPLMRTAKDVPEGMASDVPYVLDIAPDETARKIIAFLIADGEVGRPFIASRAVPAERIAILREAFAATVKDPDFLAEAKSLRIPVAPRSGQEAAKAVDQLYATPPDIIAAAHKVVFPTN